MNNSPYKKNIIIIAILFCAVILLGRLFYIQVIDTSYKITANNNVLRYEVQYPARGLVFDRNGELMVGNKTTYDIMVIPREMKAIDTLDLCNLFDISYTQCKSILENVDRKKKRQGYQAVVFLKQVPAEIYALFQEKSFKYPGFYAQVRTLRSYPRNVAGNLLGYVTEVDTAAIRRNPYYKMGDYIGKSGIEGSYEEALRGRKGVSIYERDVHNQIKKSYDDGKYDTTAIAGKDLICTIDIKLQEYGELLMQNKIGSIVAIDPGSGEILALISAPGIDPSLLVGINRNFQQLQMNPLRPLFTRAVMSSYPPGSVFKVANALIGQQEGILTPETRYGCAMGYKVGRGVDCHAHPSPLDLRQSIQMSCNAYYCYVFRNLIDNPKYDNISDAFNQWRKYVQSFGFGSKLDTDIPQELGGTLPTTDIYDRIHGKNKWKSLSIISLAIGQGEIGTTPLHLANFAALIANKGYYYTPHVVRNVVDEPENPKYKEKRYCMIDPVYFEPVIDGMYLAVNGGQGATASWVKIPGIDMCGKTGTVQNTHGENHSVFMSFAPRENPKIAIAVYMENAGWGSTWAAPVASLLTEYYLTGEVKRKDMEDRIVAGNFMSKESRAKKRK
ncbi:MAG: penicillin-binding transpeptidase domain-containing protein [Bacteroidales bacterium]|nr:penicillin-binding transpeptidase domain-containing protein [Bacteroidales bacterium]MCL2133351.1 penicillin-binding transpeptidase domain-containing protein [Bacteroidales bacterium]